MLADSPVVARTPCSRPTGSSTCSATSTTPRPTATSCPRTRPSSAQAHRRGAPGADRRRHLPEILAKWGVEAGAITTRLSTASERPESARAGSSRLAPPRSDHHVSTDTADATRADQGGARPAPRPLGRHRRPRGPGRHVPAHPGHQRPFEWEFISRQRCSRPPVLEGFARHLADQTRPWHRRRAGHRGWPSCACPPTRSCAASPSCTPGSSGPCPAWCCGALRQPGHPVGAASSSACRSTGSSARCSASTCMRGCSASIADELLTGFVAGVLALGLSEAAYMAEIVRAGIQSVDPGRPRRRTRSA